MAIISVFRQHVEALTFSAPVVSVFRQHVEALTFSFIPPVVSVFRQHAEVLSSTDIPNLTPSATSTIVFTQEGLPTHVCAVTAENTLTLAHSVDYIGPKEVEAQSILVLSHIPYYGQVYEASATSTLDLSISLAHFGTQRVNAETVITFQQFGDTTVKVRREESTLLLSQAATVEKSITASSQLTLTQSGLVGMIEVSAASTLSFQQSIRVAPAAQTADTQINLSVSARSSIKSISEGHALSLTQTAVVTKPIRVSAESQLITSELVYNPETFGFDLVFSGLGHTASVSPQLQFGSTSYLSFSQAAHPGHVRVDGDSVSATSTISFTHSAIVNLTGDGSSTLTLTQAAFGSAGTPVDSQLDLTHLAAQTIVRAQTSTTSIGLTQAASFTLIIGSTTCQYSPFVGSTTDPDAPTPPSLTVNGPMAGIQVPFQLVYPSVGPVTDSVSLKAPNLGNKDRLSFNRILRETRGGTVIVFSDPDWPQIQTQVLSFSGLLRVEAQELMTFFEDHLGQEIGMIDWEHRFWKGVITTPEEPVVEDTFDNFTASFSFEGELDPTWNPQVVPPSLRYSATRSEQQGGYYVPNEPILPATPDTTFYSAEAGVDVKIGYPLYLSSGLVYPAQANAAGSAQVVGVSIEDVSAGVGCTYITEGSVTRADWTDVSGSVSLSSGATYYLDPSTAGRITTTSPTASGQYVVRIGRAVNTTTLDIEIELPIRL